MPKPNAYQSLHTSVIGPEGQPFEVQIRTRDMDEIAEDGIAAHWMYKEGAQLGARRRAGQLAARAGRRAPGEPARLPRLPASSTSTRTRSTPSRPRGEVFAFPRGATPIDFAYRVHTEVGHHCVGARINGRLVPLRTALANGDIVEILTSPSQVPSRDWLELAVTARAKNKIRAWLNRGEKEQAVDGRPPPARARVPAARPVRSSSSARHGRLGEDRHRPRVRQGRGLPRRDRLRADLGRATCCCRWCGRRGRRRRPRPPGPRAAR